MLSAAFAALALLDTTTTVTAASAEDHASATTRVLTQDLLSPLSLAVADDGSVCHAESFKSPLLSKKSGRTARTASKASRSAPSPSIGRACGSPSPARGVG